MKTFDFFSIPKTITSKSTAFTLAEILITIAVIGIVAALTIPSVVASYKKQVVVTKLMRVYSTMNNAIQLSEIENGNAEEWPELLDFNYRTARYQDVKNWYDKYLNKYLKSNKLSQHKTSDNDTPVASDGSLPNENLLVYLPDGSILEIRNNLRDMYYYIDEKALKHPEYGKNRFSFRFAPSATEEYNKYAYKKRFVTYTYNWNGTREQLLRGADNSCAQSGQFCAALIQYDGWKISKDYPIKF